ncbi:helix-turn-helix domain-containing protein [Neorhizobium sp. T6_25]|uniref:helix-turn-helix domain-containing protein n=1 Tax=Neorhizobium sp. T6_25 TaxID=2093833 RepID=UPI000CFA330F|nr:helix-turn-helix domain-containing protein [Neorhizobium sp. T6_25]
MTAHVQPSTYEDRVISRAKAARAACYGKAKVVNIAPTLRLPADEPHELDEGRTFLTPVDFIRSRCALRSITFDQITVHDRAAAIVSVRNLIIRETNRRYPDMSIAQLAKYFRRNHTTILHALGRIPEKAKRVLHSGERDRLARELYHQGLSIAEIAQQLGVVESTVRGIRKRHGWEARTE